MTRGGRDGVNLLVFLTMPDAALGFGKGTGSAVLATLAETKIPASIFIFGSGSNRGVNLRREVSAGRPARGPYVCFVLVALQHRLPGISTVSTGRIMFTGRTKTLWWPNFCHCALLLSQRRRAIRWRAYRHEACRLPSIALLVEAGPSWGTWRAKS